MSELLSDAEFLGTPAPAAAPSRVSTGRITPAPTKPTEPAPAKPAARVVSDEEFLSGKKDTFKQPTTFDLALQSGMEAAKNLGGSAAVLADMVLSLPGFVMGVGAQAGGTIAAAARGVPLSAPEPQRDPFDKRPQVLNPVTAYGVGREAGHMVSEPFMNPLQKLFTMLKSGDAYSGSSGGKAMEKFGSLVEDAGKWVEERTNGGVSRDAVPMLVDTVMASAVGLGAKKPGIDPQAVARMRAQLKDLAADAQSKALERDMAEPAAQSPVARAGQRQVQQQINELLGIVPDEVRAQQAKERRKQVQQAFRSPDQSWQYPGREYDSILESIAKADERMGAEAAWVWEQNWRLLQEDARGALDVEARAAEQAKQPERIGQAEILRIMQKPGHERTAEDLITLREARRQGGNVRPEVPLLLSAAGLGAIAGAELSDDDLRGALLGGATGTAMALPFMWRGESVPRSFRQAGAVKEPGGMWHPEAVERLAEPLKNRLIDMQAVDRLSTAELDALHGPVLAWADKAIRNYLNKYAGTARDPLKDVEVPYGEGTKRWEEIVDAVTKKEVVGRDVPQSWKGYENAKPGETVYDLNASASGPAQRMLQSYLSHVGDYLRQNVKPEDLAKYDLTRAVQETYKNDLRVAKQMEKAAADSSKQLPVYKEYPDGYRWVEIKEPKELTPEQAKSVRRMTVDEVKQTARDLGEDYVPGDQPYVALDANGKPLRNSYTGEIAGGPTLERAYLAGELAKEGNQMGHCVGGYCEGVAAGESRIYSLRDPKGQSHVTVEVEPLSTGTLDISQIKGKQNRAPNPQYLPYVQDFVKGGKWGEVADLNNTGLVDLNAARPRSKELNEIYGRVREEKYPGQRYLTSEEVGALDLEVGRVVGPARFQRGSIDPQLAIGLGSIGLGALAGYALSEDSPGTGALLGALAGGALALPGAKQRIKQAGELAEFGLGLLSTSIRNLSPAIRLEARRFEMRNLEQAHAYLSRVTPWLKEMQSAPTELRSAIQRNDPNGIAAQMKGNAPLISGWREVRNVLNELGTKLYGEGRFKSMLDDYFPRLVKDFEGLKEALDQPIRTALEKKLEAAEKKAMGMRGFPLTAIERSSIINRELAGYSRPSNVNEPGFTQRRTVKDLTKELEKFYYTPEEALFAYVRGAVEDIEMARFFGKNKVEKTVGGRQLIDVNTSSGNVVGEELARGKITPKDAAKLEELLRDRFEGGQRAPSRYISELRAYMNMGLLGNLASASIQIADTAMPAYAQSIRSAMTAAARTVAGRNRVSAKDFGLADHIAEEFVGGGYQAPSLAKKILVRGALPAAGAVAGAVLGEDIGGAAVGAAAGATLGSIATVGMANTLNKVFKYSGFSAVDRFGKTVHLEAALDRWSRATRSEKGMTQLREKYGEAFRDSFPQLVQDLKTGKLSEDVRLLLFSELSDFQPISKLEMPQAYLRHPNGRLYYTLKSFMLKQFDIVRRDALQEIHKGFTQEGQRHRVATGLKNLTAYATVLGISGAGAEVVRQWILGEPVHFDKTDIMENVLKTFGWAQWTRDMWAKGERTKAVLGQAIPPYRLMDNIINKDPKAIQQIPVLGKLYYKWELGGREEAELREAKKAKKEGKEYDLSSRAEEYKERKRDRLKERREARRERE